MIREVETGVAVIDQFPVFESDGYTKHSGLTTIGGDFIPTVYRDSVIVALPVIILEIGSTGEYSVSFIPTIEGCYELQIFIDYNKDIWHSQYGAVNELTNTLASQARNQVVKIDLAPVDPSTAVNDSLVDQLFNKDGSKTFNPATDSLEAISDSLNANGAATSVLLAQMQADLSRVLGLLHRNGIVDLQTYDGQGQLTSARLRVFDSPANVPTNPGGSETVGLRQKYEISAAYGGLNVVTKFTLKQVL